MAGGASVSIKNIDKLLKELDKKKAGAETALKRTLSDARKAAPGIVADGVRTKYNIKKAEITGGKVVRVRTEGTKLEDMCLHYWGRMLTPVHFGMTPKAPPAGKSYTLKAQILKGGKKAIGSYKAKRTPGGPYSAKSPFVLMGTGANSEEGVSHIPFQRQAPGHRPTEGIHKMTTLSVPQMIDNPEVREIINGKLSDKIKTRLDYHMSRV